MNWAELNSRQFAALSRDTICVLPLGAIEQHGPHLAVATDQVIADAIATRLDAALAGKVLVMPALAAACSEHHMAFEGTLTLQHDSYSHVIMDILQSAGRHGFRRFFLLNAHGGNMAVGGVVAEQAAMRMPESEVVFSTWFRTASQQLRPLVKGDYPAVGHACEFETSLMLALRPDLVDVEAIVDDGVVTPSPLLRADMLSAGPTVQSVPFERITRSGVWGKPSVASAEKGRAILDIVVDVYVELFAAHWPDAPGLHRQDRVTEGAPVSADSGSGRASG